MQLMASNTPVIVTKAVVSGLSTVVCTTISHIYQILASSANMPEIEKSISSLYLKTDVELIGALLSDLSEELEMKKSIRVCLDHLHHSLQDINKSLIQLDRYITRSSISIWTNYRNPDPTLIIEEIHTKKKQLDHVLSRLVEIQHIF